MKEIIITYILNYFIIFLFAFFYTKFNFGTLDEYVVGPALYVILVFSIIISIFLYFKNKRDEQKIKVKDCICSIALGISISLIFNMFLFLFFGNSSSELLVPFSLLLISSGIVGPIYEEILFRYIFYNRLIKKRNLVKSIFINSLIFAFIHFSIIKSIYAFILGIFLCLIYHKKKNIFIPILVHISANSVVLFLNGFSYSIFLTSIIVFFIYAYIIFFQ